MISAKEARKNVMIHESEVNAEIDKKIDEFIEVISTAIDRSSRQGIRTLRFFPYDETRFSTDHAKNRAYFNFAKILADNGYIIIENNIENNSLKIEW